MPLRNLSKTIAATADGTMLDMGVYHNLVYMDESLRYMSVELPEDAEMIPFVAISDDDEMAKDPNIGDILQVMPLKKYGFVSRSNHSDYRRQKQIHESNNQSIRKQ